MRKTLLGLVLGTSLGLLGYGCQRNSSIPGSTVTPVVSASSAAIAYPYKEIPPVDVDNEIQFYQDRIKKVPKDANSRVSLARSYLSKAQSSGDVSYFREAEKLVESALQSKPTKSKAARLVLASLCEARHDFQGAFKIAKALETENKGDLDARALMANSLMEMGRLQEALESSRQNYQQLPATGSALQLARVLIATGQDEVARKLIADAIAREQPQENKASARLRSLMGDMELRYGHLEAAEAWLQASLEAVPDNPQSWEILAKVKLRQGQPAEAETLYLQAFAKTQHPFLLREVASIKKGGGDQTEAHKMLEQAETLLKPEVASGSYGHARDLACVYLDLNRPQEALQLLEREEKQRQDWRLYEIKAIALERCQRRDEALSVLKKAIATGILQPSLYQRAALWEPSGGWQEKLTAIDPTYREALLL